jgi:hypothetical protein
MPYPRHPQPPQPSGHWMLYPCHRQSPRPLAPGCHIHAIPSPQPRGHWMLYPCHRQPSSTMAPGCHIHAIPSPPAWWSLDVISLPLPVPTPGYSGARLHHQRPTPSDLTRRSNAVSPPSVSSNAPYLSQLFPPKMLSCLLHQSCASEWVPQFGLAVPGRYNTSRIVPAKGQAACAGVEGQIPQA